MPAREPTVAVVDVRGIGIELRRFGHGPPLLVLPGEEMLEFEHPLLDQLARDYEVIVPAPPGFGRSDRPDWIGSPDDISYVYLDLLDLLELDNIALLGFSLGGWIGAEIATKSDRRFSRLVLVAPYGVKVGAPTDRDIADIWMLHPNKIMGLKWFDPAKGTRDFTKMPEDQLEIIARNSESFARFCWEPCLHNAKLKHRLHRIKTPTLLVWGENDGITALSYGKAYAELIPGARIATIAHAGHYPHLEQPAEFIAQLREFLVPPI
jgi:pimeloyl-ACP methyl ester carboxylesterase